MLTDDQHLSLLLGEIAAGTLYPEPCNFGLKRPGGPIGFALPLYNTAPALIDAYAQALSEMLPRLPGRKRGLVVSRMVAGVRWPAPVAEKDEAK